MKETKEAIIALVTIGKFVQLRVKDGVDISDAVALGTALFADGELKKVLDAGAKDINLVDDELKDFSLEKAFELAQVLPEVIAILKKEEIK